MTDAERESIARLLFEVTSSKERVGGIELAGLCPFHGETVASFGYHVGKDTYHCFGCKVSGDLVDLWCHVNGHHDKSDGMRAFLSANGKEPSHPGCHVLTRPQPQRRRGETERQIIPEEVWARMELLPSEWRARLSALRGWSGEAIGLLDIRAQTAVQSKDGEIVMLTNPDRVAIPIRDDNGNLINVRRYKPGAKEHKILSWAAGYGGAALFPPGSTLANKQDPIILCEGEPDTICAISYGITAITQTSKTTRWSEEDLAHFKGRHVVIAYDADQAGQDFAKTAATNLSTVTKKINFLEWPDFMGRGKDGSWPKTQGEDLTDFFVKHARKRAEFDELVESARPFKSSESKPKEKPSPTPPPDGAEFFELKNNRWTFIHRRLAEQLRKDVEIMYDPTTELLYRWNGMHWEEYHQDHLARAAINYLGDESKMDRVRDACTQARLLSNLPADRKVDDKQNMLCMSTGMVDISDLTSEQTITISPHRKDYYATYMLDIAFDPRTVAQCPRWLKYLDETIKDEQVIRQVQEFFGYCLTRETRYEKALFLFGPGSDGKSTMLKVLRSLVGERNTASVSFNDIEDQFYRSALYGKMLNVSTEIGAKVMDSQYFKAIVSGDSISAAFKNQTPFDFTPTCKLAFATNTLPRVTDNSHGFFRKVMLIPFRHQFKRGRDADVHLIDKLLAELPGIFQWSLAGLRRLRANGDFTQANASDDLLREYMVDNNPVLYFVLEHCETGQSCECHKKGLYDAYHKWTRESGYSTLGKAKFFRELKTAITGLDEYQPNIDGTRPRYVKGVQIAMTSDLFSFNSGDGK